MTQVSVEMQSGPVLVRESPPPDPGTHSHNLGRRVRVYKTRNHSRLAIATSVLGITALGYCSYLMADRYIYQEFENWSFDQQIAGHSSVSLADYFRERSPFRFFFVEKGSAFTPPPAMAPALEDSDVPQRPAHGSVLGRVSVPRLNISSVVREGVDAATMDRAVGHVPATALAGQLGNFAIAAHRDTLFRALKDIKIADQVVFQSAAGNYTYEVVSTKIVKPSDVTVLRADGGPGASDGVANSPDRLLTMITCYPFNYTKAAPKRFIVQARLIPPIAPKTPPAATQMAARHIVKRPSVRPVRMQKPRPHVSYSHPAAARPVKPPKRGFWRKFLHIS